VVSSDTQPRQVSSLSRYATATSLSARGTGGGGGMSSSPYRVYGATSRSYALTWTNLTTPVSRGACWSFLSLSAGMVRGGWES
jgi:hypothetical protein